MSKEENWRQRGKSSAQKENFKCSIWLFGKISPAKNRKIRRDKKKGGHEMCLLKENFNAVKVADHP